uniref:Uncharacterized protein n=1 Tax=Ditylenchus dipsaci TaxID=166011 RepID=A0A915DHH7_9BILA
MVFHSAFNFRWSVLSQNCAFSNGHLDQRHHFTPTNNLQLVLTAYCLRACLGPAISMAVSFMSLILHSILHPAYFWLALGCMADKRIIGVLFSHAMSLLDDFCPRASYSYLFRPNEKLLYTFFYIQDGIRTPVFNSISRIRVEITLDGKIDLILILLSPQIGPLSWSIMETAFEFRICATTRHLSLFR